MLFALVQLLVLRHVHAFVFAHKNKILMHIELEPILSVTCERANKTIPVELSRVIMAANDTERKTSEGLQRLQSFQLFWPNFGRIKRRYFVQNSRTIVEKLGQPVPESNFASEPKSGFPHAAQA